ncbi:sugar ABC transporter ATP-binding protein [Nocardioides sp.]|uniref:sugar ABC transporter ATP-binding protein n=1 Tax=Nocardioides sp. TaxID=35761 RepID=UPI0039E49788
MTSSPGTLAVPVALAATGIRKSFGETHALADVDLTVREGEIHALLGGNGSGKSTLIKILAGVYQADAGELGFGDATRSLASWSPSEARAAGLHFVHQDPAIFPGLSVTENLSIGHGFETTRAGRINWRLARRRATQVLERFEIDARPTTLASALRPAERTMLAIARALQDEEEVGRRGILVLDEPTASLPVHEVDFLLAALRRHAAGGGTIVYVSHRLGEVLSIADHVTALRDGRLAGSRSLSGATEADLVEMIVGRPLESYYPPPTGRVGRERRVEVRGLVAGPLKGIDLDIHAGEILGIAGLLGTGRTELLRAIFGDLPKEAGEVRIDGSPADAATPRQAMDAGIALVPEDRAGEALFASMSVRENLSATALPDYWRGLRLRHAQERADASRLIDEYDIRPPRDSVTGGSLSGGNAQKVVMARWLRKGPRLLLLDEPTQGVDVGARLTIYEQVRAAAANGMAVLLVSSDFEELAHLADRVLVVKNGRVSHEVTPPIEANRLTELCLATEVGGAQ